MKKLENVMFGVCLALIVFIAVILKPLSNLDEIWNFNVARAISNGLVPYKDISMVSTPLLGFISAIPLKLIGQEMFYSRILTVVLVLISFILTSKILKNLDIKKEISNLIILLVLLIMLNFIIISYNLLALIFVLQIMLLELKSLKNEKWNNLFTDAIIGIFSGLLICSKQSVGLIASAIVIFSPMFYIKNKSDVKNYIKKCIVRFTGVLLPIIIFVTYLLVNNAFWDFLSYSVNGVSTFSNSRPYFSLMNENIPHIKILAVIVPIVIIGCIIATIILKYKKKQNNILYILVTYSAAMFSIIFPISDGEHLVICIIPAIILIAYLIKGLILKYFKGEYKYALKFFNLFPVICVLVIALGFEIINNEELGQISKYDYLNHFRYINVSKELKNAITDLDDYILASEKNVYILDSSAAVYMIPIDRYNKDYDMFCVGNLGASGEEGIIEKIKKEDALYLILKDESKLNWQNPNKVRAYVKENMEYIQSKGCYEVYQNKQIVNEETNQEENIVNEEVPAEQINLNNEEAPAEPVNVQN